jgi:hypothetical protein
MRLNQLVYIHFRDWPTRQLLTFSTVTDDAGNRNNLLTIPIHEETQENPTEDGATNVKENSPVTMTEPTSPPPALVVEKVDSVPSHGDDFGKDATVGQKDAHKLRAQDAEPDYVVVRARTPDIASSAAEVADSAMTLDRDVSVPKPLKVHELLSIVKDDLLT